MKGDKAKNLNSTDNSVVNPRRSSRKPALPQKKLEAYLATMGPKRQALKVVKRVSFEMDKNDAFKCGKMTEKHRHVFVEKPACNVEEAPGDNWALKILADVVLEASPLKQADDEPLHNLAFVQPLLFSPYGGWSPVALGEDASIRFFDRSDLLTEEYLQLKSTGPST